MVRLRDLLSRLRGTLRARDVDARLDEETRFHLEMHAPREQPDLDAMESRSGRELGVVTLLLESSIS
jgi:hypothetical protein